MTTKEAEAILEDDFQETHPFTPRVKLTEKPKLEDYKYPIAEIFEAPQGEGEQSGLLMTHIRLAGCSVGKPFTQDERANLFPQQLASYQEKCTDWQGNSFPCDTNYRMSQRLTAEQILELPEVKDAEWCSITGGEPLIHNLPSLLTVLYENDKKVHLETSGTIFLNLDDYPDLREFTWTGNFWCVVSPKKGVLTTMLDFCDEIRVVVDKDFDEKSFLTSFESYIEDGKVWISPINNLVTLNRDNIEKCLELQSRHKKLKISLQIHKILGCR